MGNKESVAKIYNVKIKHIICSIQGHNYLAADVQKVKPNLLENQYTSGSMTKPRVISDPTVSGVSCPS